MRIKYIWQRPEWPELKWKNDSLIGLLGQARKAQGKIIAQANVIGLEEHADLIVEEAFATSAIEGEKLDRHTIRSSVARRLGLPTAGLPSVQRSVDGLVEMLLDATINFNEPLTSKRLHGWQAALFPTGYSGIQPIKVGEWRTGTEPMQVVSGAIGREKIHFEAPSANRIPQEIKSFLVWWEQSKSKLDGVVRAAVAHFWFVTIHPYEDGNGRIARAITDLALSQDENSSRRLYNLSTQIIKERETYYATLESCQKGTCDITVWLEWFLGMFERAIHSSEVIISKAIMIARFWQTHSKGDLNGRQIKVINKLLEAEPVGFEGGINNRKYVSITGTSRETAKRDLSDLESKGYLARNQGKGRSTSYSIKI